MLAAGTISPSTNGYLRNCFNFDTSRVKFATLFLFIFLLASSDANGSIENVDDTIKISDDKKSCSCSWSRWMNSGPPSSGEDETYTTLRKKGFEFCSSPVDIQCYNYDDDTLHVGFGSLCDVSLGFTCSILCNDYGVRVACCYCPPEAAGPEFQITSEGIGGGCLQAVTNTSLLIVTDACNLNDLTQSWVWVSRYSIMNVKTQRCLAVNNRSVVLEDCDLDAKTQKWKYFHRSKLLRYGTTTYSYLKRVGAGVLLDASRGRDTQWLARVSEGITSLKNMKNFPCEPLSAVGHGDMSCTLGRYVSSECTFSCEYGYRLPEGTENPSKCTDDGLFTVDAPQCEKIECLPSVDSIEHGTVRCSNGNSLDSSCVFRCDDGFARIGTNQLICTDEEEWTDARPTCERVVCKFDFEKMGLSHGTVDCTNEAVFGSVCTFTCLEGHELDGPAMRSCQLDGTWSGNQPVCNKIQCPAISTAENTQVLCSAEVDYLSTCEFLCHAGYSMVGSASSVCTADKAWSSEPPTCERKTCNALGDPSNGEVFCDDSNFYHSKCSFTCNRGFEIGGEESLRCTDEGWNVGAPTCEQITCDRRANPRDGAVSCTDNEMYESICTFSCLLGFVLDGVESNKCVENGWNHPAPSCQQITCPAILNPTNGKVFCPKDNIYGSNCFVLCNEGYRTPESSSRAPVTCQLDGSWTNSIATCARIQCPDISIGRGSMTCTDANNFNSECTFQCKEGFTLVGNERTTCTGSGWDEQAPSCDRVTCLPMLTRPAKGQIDCDSSGVTVCRFSCDAGHELVGASVSECQHDATWSVTDIPVCRAVKCSALPPVPLHGNVTCSGGVTFDAACDFNCDAGYSLVGARQTRCTERRTWDRDTPACEKISCPNLAAPFHGRMDCSDEFLYESKCSYKCDPGYLTLGPKLVECLHDAVWSETPPFCGTVTCSPTYSNPSDGTVDCSDASNFGSVCKFSCEVGFTLVGGDRSMCGTSGWTLTAAPTCKQITCPVGDGRLPNGSIRCSRSNSYGSRCSYSCNRGYELTGAKDTECTDGGRWSNATPSCTEIQCPEIPKPRNGRVVCDRKSAYGSKCRFVCYQGYARRPDTQSARCMGNRRWNPAGFPVCEVSNVTMTTVQLAAASPSVITTSKPRTSTTVVITTTAPTTADTTEVATFETTQALPNGKGLDSTPPSTTQDLRSEMRTSSRFISTAGPKIRTTPVPDVASSRKNSAVDQEQGFPIVIVAAAVGAAIFIFLLAVFIVMCKRKNKKKLHNRPASSTKTNNRHDDTELGALLHNGNGLVAGEKFAKISLDRLEMEYNRRHADDDKMFREEFRSLADGRGSKEAGGRAKNKDKNRYTNILPYDHSRVVLPKIGGDADSDYINASFVDGYKHKGKFIAAQGPKTNTVGDFWRMVWEQKVSTIIMATSLEERKEQKCAMYWPEMDDMKQNYGEIAVTHIGENHLVDFTVRTFSVQKIGADGDVTMSSKRTVTQYHFTSWPDFGVPKSPSGILKFLRKIKQGSPIGYGPIVVHCSAGVGRTGTFICIDAMLEMISKENAIDVHGFCSQMRHQRTEMVQTEQQYIFIYQAILEHHLYGDTEVDSSEVASHVEELMQQLPGDVTGMEHEFNKLTSVRIQKENMRAGNHPENMRKNRVLLILPYDWNRVMLPIKRGQENSDYINASYIDGYRQKDSYVATQGPLPHTIEDFWRMIWRSQCASIVMLTKLMERGQAKCAQYWPSREDGVLTFGDMEVELSSTAENEDYSERDFRVSNVSSTDQKQIVVKQFHYHGWPEDGAPVSGHSMIQLVEAVQRQQQASGNNPIVIHCSAGAGRTGAFCALSTALEQVKAEGVLDMFQIVKCLRMQRPHMVQTLDQYEFCYRAVQEYIDSMSGYCNFR